ncbi:MAG: UDP-N-acetylglucosamine 1-carboxyvinyltransferase, partial [SAR324 cluster bacterium]|nr:UDP-N-acetylglucosamine 1-carboxyvinyltransferase [SAR324 cluster bacterium]
MAEYIEITGGFPLKGSVRVSGAKNAALPLLIASLLTSEKCEFSNLPNLLDVNILTRLLEHFGGQVSHQGNEASIQIPKLIAIEARYSLVKALRASFWILAPLLARGGAARVALPGGDIIGARPVDMHLEAFAKMGADVVVKHGVVYATAPQGLHPATINLRFPSVGATHQILMAASLINGTSVINGAAREPEVVALAEMLSQMGAKIEGAGSSTIRISGCSELGGARVKVIGDRIEAGTYMLAAAVTKGDIQIDGINAGQLGQFKDDLQNSGLSIKETEDGLHVKASERLRALKIRTSPFPGFATDMQAPTMAALCTAEGESTIEENVFEGRFGHVAELCRMGASIKVEERVAHISGVDALNGAPVEGFDIRGAAALVIAALGADGLNQV